MITRDYHQFRFEEAIRDIESLVSEIRLSGRSEEADFIVGHGVIRTCLISMLRNYGLDPKVQLGNAGVIKCIIE